MDRVLIFKRFSLAMIFSFGVSSCSVWPWQKNFCYINSSKVLSRIVKDKANDIHVLQNNDILNVWINQQKVKPQTCFGLFNDSEPETLKSLTFGEGFWVAKDQIVKKGKTEWYLLVNKKSTTINHTNVEGWVKAEHLVIKSVANFNEFMVPTKVLLKSSGLQTNDSFPLFNSPDLSLRSISHKKNADEVYYLYQKKTNVPRTATSYLIGTTPNLRYDSETTLNLLGWVNKKDFLLWNNSLAIEIIPGKLLEIEKRNGVKVKIKGHYLAPNDLRMPVLNYSSYEITPKLLSKLSGMRGSNQITKPQSTRLNKLIGRRFKSQQELFGFLETYFPVNLLKSQWIEISSIAEVERIELARYYQKLSVRGDKQFKTEGFQKGTIVNQTNNYRWVLRVEKSDLIQLTSDFHHIIQAKNSKARENALTILNKKLSRGGNSCHPVASKGSDPKKECNYTYKGIPIHLDISVTNREQFASRATNKPERKAYLNLLCQLRILHSRFSDILANKRPIAVYWNSYKDRNTCNNPMILTTRDINDNGLIEDDPAYNDILVFREGFTNGLGKPIGKWRKQSSSYRLRDKYMIKRNGFEYAWIPVKTFGDIPEIIGMNPLRQFWSKFQINGRKKHLNKY